LQTPSSVAQLSVGYQVDAHRPYLVAGGVELTLNVLTPRGARQQKRPTVVYFHGGGWRSGSKEEAVLLLLPFLEMGFNAVNVEYRLSTEAHAPAAVEDARCALRWVRANADEYGFDTDRILLTGHSAGAHLALMAGLARADDGFDRRCPAAPRMDGTDGETAHPVQPDMPVAAIINWFGITDVADLLDGPNTKGYAVEWIGAAPHRVERAERVSPLTYVRDDAPPVLTIHGDADQTVPFSHAERLHQALDDHDVPNRLLTVEGKGHGNFDLQEAQEALQAVRTFLMKHGFRGK
jgi:acetyl esterase/lipase